MERQIFQSTLTMAPVSQRKLKFALCCHADWQRIDASRPLKPSARLQLTALIDFNLDLRFACACICRNAFELAHDEHTGSI